MREEHKHTALYLGAFSGAAVAVLTCAYVVVLAIGLATLPSSDAQIQQPWFTLMELLILAIAPLMVALAAAVHAWSPPDRKALTLVGVTLFAMCAMTTCAVHFSILALSRLPVFAVEPWPSLVFGFRWPSLAYALDILAWDVFFPLGALFLASALQGIGLVGRVRLILIASAALAFIGLLGVPTASMDVRNIGILGYAVLFPIAAALLAVIFLRSRPAGAA